MGGGGRGGDGGIKMEDFHCQLKLRQSEHILFQISKWKKKILLDFQVSVIVW